MTFKELTIRIFILLLLISLSLFMFFVCINSLKESNKRAKSFIGKKVIVDSDTLTIINYKNEFNFVLSNGVVVNKKIVENFLIKE